MMRKFTTYLIICSTWCYLSSCNDDEASAPPKTSFTQDKTATLTGDEVTFVIDQVDADAIALLPYGQTETGKGGVLIPKSAFENSKATVKFSYDFIGTFSPVVVTTNYTGDGKSVEHTYSDAKSITVSSDNNAIDAFTFSGSTKTTIDQDLNTIVVEMPYADDKSVPYNITSLKASFSASPYTTVKVGGTTQTSGETANNFTSPVTYTVTAADGTVNSYLVTVNMAGIETNTNFKSVSGKTLSTTFKDKQLQGYVGNADKVLVLIAPFGQAQDVLDSVRVGYALDGKFSTNKFATSDKPMKQDSLLNLLGAAEQITVIAQNTALTSVYDIKGAIAPKLALAFNGLNPTVAGALTDFDIKLNVLKGTVVTALATTSVVTLSPGQTGGAMTVTTYDVNPDGITVPFNDGDVVNYSKPVKFSVTVTDSNIGETFTVNYTVTVVVVP